MTAIELGLLNKLKELPPQKLAEVEDFIDFLRAREEQHLTGSFTKASESSFAAVWDNDDDAAYDQL